MSFFKFETRKFNFPKYKETFEKGEYKKFFQSGIFFNFLIFRAWAEKCAM